jgi:cytochrome oxidase Cu insertion factor (SCO1/SenC/PrrC family)
MRGRRAFVLGSLLATAAIAAAAIPTMDAAEPAPAFTLKLLDGGTLKLDDLRGKVGVLRFMASW